MGIVGGDGVGMMGMVEGSDWSSDLIGATGINLQALSGWLRLGAARLPGWYTCLVVWGFGQWVVGRGVNGEEEDR